MKSVTLGVWIGTGSRFEDEKSHGISHFLEHLMFKGTGRRSAKDIAEAIDAVGGQLNAFTAKEYTCYYIKVLDVHRELAMDILSDMLLNSKFAAEDIERERQVVLEEVHMYEDSPDELVHDIYLDAVWPGHPLGRNILGAEESIEGFDRRLVLDFYHSHYTADNIVVAAAGNLEHEALVELAGKHFGGFSGNKKDALVHPPQYTPTRLIHSKETEQVHLCLGTASVSQSSPDIYPTHIINNILGGGISSRLFQSIREERGLAYSVYSYQANYRDAGLFTVYAGTRPNNIGQVVELIMKNIMDLQAGGVTKEEFIKAKEQIKGNLLLGLESSSSRMSRIGKMEITLGRYISLDEVVDKIERVAEEDIWRMIKKMFVSESLCLTALGPIQSDSIPDVRKPRE
ncbi:M16 family metallopeptidase [Methylomusa anaerophila]|uniref:M16 family metallopeptidase n=1 Tax=Methylomusa anaerophila TaxID=1930071 RepID=UPI001E44C4CD